MTPKELHEYIDMRDGILGGDEISYAETVKLDPPINHIIFNHKENKIQMWTETGEYFEFTPMLYEEYLEKKKGR